MFKTGADVDIKKIEEEIRKEIDEKRKRLFSDDDLEELQKMELEITPNPERVRPFFYRELEFSEADLKFYDTDYNIDLNTFLYSAESPFLMKLRNWFRPFFRLHGNVDAVIHKQAIFNQQQAQFNTWTARAFQKPFHYIRVLHTLINYLISEFTKLSLHQQMLKSQVDALAYDLDQLRKRERLLEKMVVLKEESKEPGSR
jgi:hypothetical protein